MPNPKLKLLEQVREVLRLRHYSIRTERCGQRFSICRIAELHSTEGAHARSGRGNPMLCRLQIGDTAD
jgi:hypothetical protein